MEKKTQGVAPVNLGYYKTKTSGKSAGLLRHKPTNL